MPNKRGRPPIKPKIMADIIRAALADRRASIPKSEWRAPKALAIDLQKELIKKHGESPTEKTLEKKISDCRRQNDPHDNPWALSALSVHPLPPGVLPVLLEIQFLQGIENEASPGYSSPLTIREAMWVSYLQHVFTDSDAAETAELVRIVQDSGKDAWMKWVKRWASRRFNLESWARAYAMEERVAELCEVAMDTTVLDAKLREVAIFGQPGTVTLPPRVAEILKHRLSTMPEEQLSRLERAYDTCASPNIGTKLSKMGESHERPHRKKG